MKADINKLNKKIRKCKKCGLSDTRIHAICGEGDNNAKIMLIAQAPGIKEDKENKMFIGPSGKVLDKLLNNNNIKRKSLYMTNLVKCMLPGYRKPKKHEIDICSDYLDKEIEIIDPSVLAPLGYYATEYIFKKYEIDLPKSKKEFYSSYGKLFFTDSVKILPLNHPVTIVYDPSLEKTINDDYHKLSVLSNNCKWYESCPMKKYYEDGVLDRKWVELYCKGDWESCVRYDMEEKGKLHPDCMLPDGSIDNSLKNKGKANKI